MATIITTRHDLEAWIADYATHYGCDDPHAIAADVADDILAFTDNPGYGADWSKFLEDLDLDAQLLVRDHEYMAAIPEAEAAIIRRRATLA